jgi:lysophospholipase L1-like esterase
MKKILILLLISVLGNAGLLWFAQRQYQDTNALRLDPLQLSVYATPAPAKTVGKQRVVFFGDSRALSWSVPEGANAEFINRGIGNQTSEQIRLRFAQHVKPLQADVVILQLGVNDLKAIALFPQQRDAIVAQCKRNLQDIITQARQSGSKVLLTTVFPLGKVPLERRLFWSDAIAPAINEVNQFIAAQAGDGVTVLDAFALLQGEKNLIRPEYSRDLLHLNANGYALLNQHLVETLSLLAPFSR